MELGIGRAEELSTALAGKTFPEILSTVASMAAATRGIREPKACIVKRGVLALWIDELLALDESASFLHVFRDPRAVVHSMLNSVDPDTGLVMARGNTHYAARHWMKIASVVNDKRHADVVCHVRYESAISDWPRELSQLAKCLDLAISDVAVPGLRPRLRPSEGSLHKLADRSSDSSRIAAWRHEVEPWRGRLIERECQSEMLKLGYQLEYLIPGATSRSAILDVRVLPHRICATVKHFVSQGSRYLLSRQNAYRRIQRARGPRT